MKSVAICTCLLFVTAVTAKNIGDPCDQLKYVNFMQLRSDKQLSRLFSQHKVLQPILDGMFAYVNCSLRGLTEVPKTIPKKCTVFGLEWKHDYPHSSRRF